MTGTATDWTTAKRVDAHEEEDQAQTKKTKEQRSQSQQGAARTHAMDASHVISLALVDCLKDRSQKADLWVERSWTDAQDGSGAGSWAGGDGSTARKEVDAHNNASRRSAGGTQRRSEKRKERRGKCMKDEDLNRTERREIGRCKKRKKSEKGRGKRSARLNGRRQGRRCAFGIRRLRLRR